MPYKYTQIPNPNDRTRADGEAYRQVRERQGQSLEDKANLYGVTPEEYAGFECGEGLIIPESDELWQLDNGSVRYGNRSKNWYED